VAAVVAVAAAVAAAAAVGDGDMDSVSGMTVGSGKVRPLIGSLRAGAKLGEPWACCDWDSRECECEFVCKFVCEGVNGLWPSEGLSSTGVGASMCEVTRGAGKAAAAADVVALSGERALLLLLLLLLRVRPPWWSRASAPP
jgi:hypothetical protein